MSMFDEIPFANPNPIDPTALTASPAPVTADMLAPDSGVTAVGGYWDSLFSSGKVAADAALNSVRSIFNIFSDTQSPLAAPAGPATMDRAGAGGGGVIAGWTSILVQDTENGVARAGGAVKNAINSTEQRLASAGSATWNWTLGGLTQLWTATKWGVILFFVILAIYLIGQSRALFGGLEGATR